MAGPNLPVGTHPSSGHLTFHDAIHAIVNEFDTTIPAATAGQTLVSNGTVFVPARDSSTAIVWFNGVSLPLRSTVTADATRTVFWASPLSYPPPSGSGWAIDGVDFWLVIP